MFFFLHFLYISMSVCLFVCVEFIPVFSGPDTKTWRCICLSAASPQLAGEQPHAGQSGGGAGNAGVRHHQRQNQTTRRAEDEDSGRLTGVYVRGSLIHLQKHEKEKKEKIFIDLLRPPLNLFSSVYVSPECSV